MTTTSSSAHIPETLLRAQVVWALILAVPNQVVITVRSEASEWLQRLGHHALDAGQMLALGLFAGGASYLIARRFAPAPRSALAIVAVASLLVAIAELPASFTGFAERMSESWPFDLVLWGLVVASSLSIPVAAWLGSQCTQLWSAVPALSVSLAAASLNHFVLDQDYHGLHLFITLNAFSLGSAALASLRPRWLVVELHARTSNIALALAGAIALGSLFLPSNRMLLRLSSLEGAPLARASAGFKSLFGGEVDARSVLEGLPEERRRWWRARTETVPPGPRVLPERPIVILLTIDCLRADVFRKKQKDNLSYWKQLTKTSVTFLNARSAGAATVPSLSAIFSGKHYSELVWKRRSKGGDVWPAEDDSIRFPELLQRAGVSTVTLASKSWLVNERGVVRGFEEETDLDVNRKPRTNHVKFREIRPKLQQRLARVGDEPLFFYAHLMDPHSPYDSGKRKRGRPFDRYVSEIDHVGSQLQKLDDWLEENGLSERTTLIITADHGEAFGEHSTQQHSKTVYEELVRVPLWIRVPGTAPREVTELVSLIDLGPTLLDLFGQPTPASFQGQSLVPFLRGESPTLTRPVAAEARLIQMMVFPDQTKAIFGIRGGTHELYDLTRDPKELENLAEDGAGEHSVLLRAYFAAHLNPAYEEHAPYRN